MAEHTNKPHALGTESITKLLFQYSIPAIVGMLVGALYNVVDTFFVGRMNNPYAISGVGLTYPISIVILAFSLLVGVGAAANISIRLGRRDQAGAEAVLGNALSMALFISVILTAGGILLVNPILESLGASENTLPFARDYINIILAGNVFNVITLSLNHSIRGEGNPLKSGATQFIGAGLNCILDPIFIFTFGMGVKGAACATIISQMVSCIWVLAHFFGGRSHLKFKWRNMMPQKAIILSIASIGVSPFAMQIATSVAQVILNRTIFSMGQEIADFAIGASSLIIRLNSLLLMPIIGIGQGLQPILGYNYGAKQFDRVTSALKRGMTAGTLYAIAGTGLMVLFPGFFIRLFTSDPEIIRYGTAGLRISLLGSFFLGIQILGTSYFQSVGKAQTSVLLSLLRQVFLLIPCYLIFAKLWGLTGIWAAMPVADTLSVFITVVFVWKEMQRIYQTRRLQAQY